MLIDWQKIQCLRAEIDALIAKRPKLAVLQKEIDECLSKCNSQHNRCIVINTMMWESFHKMREALIEFKSGKFLNEKQKLSLVSSNSPEKPNSSKNS